MNVIRDKALMDDDLVIGDLWGQTESGVWSRCVGPRRRPPTVHSHCMQCGVYSNVTCQPTTVLSRWVVCLVPRLDCFVLVLVQFSLLLNSLSACRSA